jgi:hypothetical protein
MNIFVLDLDVKKCAQYHNNKHVVKMILEQNQILCSVHWVLGNDAPYKLTHKNHPCSIWARECIENYVWLCEMTLELCKEYTYRYDKRHKSQDVLDWCINNLPNLPEKGSVTPFALAMPDECKVGTAIDSYRAYYMLEKRELAAWKNRQVPEWYF